MAVHVQSARASSLLRRSFASIYFYTRLRECTRASVVGLGYIAFAVSAFVRGADEAALDEHVRTFLDVVKTYSASRGRNTQTRCHSVFDAHSSSVFFHDRCVATDRTVNFEPLLFRA